MKTETAAFHTFICDDGKAINLHMNNTCINFDNEIEAKAFEDAFLALVAKHATNKVTIRHLLPINI